jgi:hypothetical protein
MLVTVVALGWARLWRARINFDDGVEMFVCSGMRGGYGRAGTTFGGAYLTKDYTGARTLHHESVHADQWAHYGLAFGPLYLIEEIRHPKARNRFEIEAGLADGGYSAPAPDKRV